MSCIRHAISTRLSSGRSSPAKPYSFCFASLSLLKMVCTINLPTCCTSREWVSLERTAALRSSGKTWVFCCKRRIAALLIMRPRSLSSAVCKLLVERISRAGVIFLPKSIIFHSHKAVKSGFCVLLATFCHLLN